MQTTPQTRVFQLKSLRRHTMQQEEIKLPLIRGEPIQTFLKRRYKNGQHVSEKNYQLCSETTNPNYSEKSPCPCFSQYYRMSKLAKIGSMKITKGYKFIQILSKIV